MRTCTTAPVSLSAFFAVFLIVTMAALLAGCTTTPAPDSAAGKAEGAATETAANNTPTAAFDLTIQAPSAIRQYLEQYLELQRWRGQPGLQPSELTRLLGAADDNARALLGTLGYFSPVIKIDVYKKAKALTGIDKFATNNEVNTRIVIAVEPGVQTKVATVQLDYSGALAQAPNFDRQRERLLRNWDLQPGAGFTQKGWDDAKTEGLRALQRRRYPTASIQASHADIDADTHQADLGVHYASGPLYKFGELTIKGAERYSAVGTARIARLPTGDDYSEAAMLDAQSRLATSGYYDSVFLSLDTSTAQPQCAPVIAQVREAKLQKVVLGIGASTDTGPRLNLAHTHNKMPWLGWRAVSDLSLERDKQRLSTEWTDLPRENGWRYFGAGELKREANGDFDVNSLSLRAGHQKSSDHIDRNAFLQYDLAAVQGGRQTIASSSALSGTYGWTGRYFNNNQNPTRGWGLAAALGAGATITPNRGNPFVRAVLRWQGFVPADTVTAPNGSTRSARFSLRAEGGSILAKRSAIIPAPQLFITGGDTTVRGYRYKTIGARTLSANIYGGRHMALASAEYQRPLVRDGEISDWEAAVFADVGSVADKIPDMSPYWGVGTGLRWRSPVGALQADIAYGIKEQRFRLHLRLGFSF